MVGREGAEEVSILWVFHGTAGYTCVSLTQESNWRIGIYTRHGGVLE